MFVTKVSFLKSINSTRNIYQLIALRNCSTTSSVGNNNRQANREHLAIIHKQLAESLPQFFVHQHCFHIYNPSIVFEDNIRNIKTIGINKYVTQLSIIKILAHLKYSHKTVKVLKITENPEDMTVRVRWRIVGTPGLSIIYAFWRYKFWNSSKNTSEDKSEWTDGFSIFYVGSDGLVHKHVVDKIMPDEEPIKSTTKTNLGVKLALLIGLVPELSQTMDLFQQIVSKFLDFGSFV